MSEEFYEDSSGDLRKYRIELPNLIDDADLSIYAFRLYVAIKRIAGAKGGACWMSARALAAHCNMGVATVSRAKGELLAEGLIEIEHGDALTRDVIRIVDIWPQNFAHYGDPHRIRRSTQDQGVIHTGSPRSTQDHGDPQGITLRSNHIRSNHIKNKPSSSRSKPENDDDGARPPIVEDPGVIQIKYTMTLQWALYMVEFLQLPWANYEENVTTCDADQLQALATWLYAYRELNSYTQSTNDYAFDGRGYALREEFLARNADLFAGVENPTGKIIQQAIKNRFAYPLSEPDMISLGGEILRFDDEDLFAEGYDDGDQ